MGALGSTMTFKHCGARVTVDITEPMAIERLRCPICGLVRWSSDPADVEKMRLADAAARVDRTQRQADDVESVVRVALHAPGLDDSPPDA
jgi:hypothetical protein